jgi:uncharacterized protein YkwD
MGGICRKIQFPELFAVLPETFKMANPKIILLLHVVAIMMLFPRTIQAQQDIRGDILQEANRVRAEGCYCGEVYMPPAGKLTWNNKLEKAAIRHARDMYNNDFFDHKGSDGSTLAKRVEAAGYKWSLLGENLAWGVLSPKDVVEGWIHSPGHCETLMNPGFKEMGAARKGTYWVMDLGSFEF